MALFRHFCFPCFVLLRRTSLDGPLKANNSTIASNRLLQ